MAERGFQSQATTKHRAAKDKQRAQACMILERMGNLALNDELDLKDSIAAAKLYLSKTMADLKAVEVSGETTTHVTGVDIKIIG